MAGILEMPAGHPGTAVDPDDRIYDAVDADDGQLYVRRRTGRNKVWTWCPVLDRTQVRFKAAKAVDHDWYCSEDRPELLCASCLAFEAIEQLERKRGA